MYTVFVTPENKKLAFLHRSLLFDCDLRLDPFTDFTLALMEGDEMLAAGSCYKNVLRSLCVRPALQGEGIIATLLTAMETELYKRGNSRIFLVSQAKDFVRFQNTGFTALTKLPKSPNLMENSSTAFPHYLQSVRTGLSNFALEKYGKELDFTPTFPSDREKLPQIGAVVMNANPFTNGHLFLAEKAAAASELLLIFVVAENSPQGLDFATRFRLVEQGVSAIPNALVVSTDAYAVSNATFPSYFYPADAKTLAARRSKDEAMIDAALFARIAKALCIVKRFVGTEPLSPVTAMYNETLRQILPQQGVEVVVTERRKLKTEAISASKVRQLWRQGDFGALRELVPLTTYEALREISPLRNGQTVFTKK